MRESERVEGERDERIGITWVHNVSGFQIPFLFFLVFSSGSFPSSLLLKASVYQASALGPLFLISL